jgi:hypothetical protein
MPAAAKKSAPKTAEKPARLPLNEPVISRPTFRRERRWLARGVWPVAGCDEAGRGPLAGPVVAAAVVLDPELARKMEPRAATPMRRLETLRRLSQAGVPTTVMVAPIIPAINDMDIERILDAAHVAGVKEAGYVILRLPLEVRDLFHEWVRANYPDRADKVIKIVRETQGGKDYDSKWFTRGRGTGPYAWLIGRRFQMTCERLGLNERRLSLDTSQFRPPQPNDDQLKLFA